MSSNSPSRKPLASVSHAEGLGFDPKEGSDLSPPSHLDFTDRPELLTWQYKDGGERLPPMFQMIPHVGESQPQFDKLVMEVETAELCHRIAVEAKQAQEEYINLKQKGDTLQAEKELLIWHLANNSKTAGLGDSRLLATRSAIGQAEQKLAVLRHEVTGLELQEDGRKMGLAKLEANKEGLENTLKEYTAEFERLRDSQKDFTRDITTERRKAEHESRLRYRQFLKLKHAAGADVKQHNRHHRTSKLDFILEDAYWNIYNYKKADVDAQEQLLGEAREKIREQAEQMEPLADFITPKGTSIYGISGPTRP